MQLPISITAGQQRSDTKYFMENKALDLIVMQTRDPEQSTMGGWLPASPTILDSVKNCLASRDHQQAFTCTLPLESPAIKLKREIHVAAEVKHKN